MRSAWMPAPPEGSDPAMLRTAGVMVNILNVRDYLSQVAAPCNNEPASVADQSAEKFFI